MIRQFLLSLLFPREHAALRSIHQDAIAQREAATHTREAFDPTIHAAAVHLEMNAAFYERRLTLIVRELNRHGYEVVRGTGASGPTETARDAIAHALALEEARWRYPGDDEATTLERVANDDASGYMSQLVADTLAAMRRLGFCVHDWQSAAAERARLRIAAEGLPPQH